MTVASFGADEGRFDVRQADGSSLISPGLLDENSRHSGSPFTAPGLYSAPFSRISARISPLSAQTLNTYWFLSAKTTSMPGILSSMLHHGRSGWRCRDAVRVG